MDSKQVARSCLSEWTCKYKQGWASGGERGGSAERFLSVLALASALTKETDNQWEGRTDFGLYRLLARLHVLASPLTYRGLCRPAKVCVLRPPSAHRAPRLRSQLLFGVRPTRAQGRNRN